jgi:hypothetical protein
MKRVISVLAAIAMVLGVATSGMSVQQSIEISATINSMSQLNVGISKIDAATGTWTQASSIDFGTLTFDTTYSIFRADCYYAVDIGVVDNTGSWTLTHFATSIINGAGNNLDNNINVTVVEQPTSDSPGIELDAVSYADSNGLTYTDASISPGSWIRIYYGIATGSSDNTGVTPITASKPAGTYTGTITLSLT